MAAAIIYGAQSKSVRRIIVDEPLILLPGHVGPGEAMLVITQSDVLPKGFKYPDLEACNRLVAQATGVQPAPARCVVLDKNLAVVSAIMADPLIDAVAGASIVREPVAAVGDVLATDGKFYRGGLSVDAIAAGTVDATVDVAL